jgi:hypothetical protein
MKMIALLSLFFLCIYFTNTISIVQKYPFVQISIFSFFILSNKPSGAFDVDTITIYGFDFAMYLSETCLASCCYPRKKAASSSNMKDTLGNPLIASK